MDLANLLKELDWRENLRKRAKEVTIELFESLDESLMAALQEDCEIWAPGIEILAIRVTKPEIPPKIRRAFEDIESERVKLMMVREQQKTLLNLNFPLFKTVCPSCFKIFH